MESAAQIISAISAQLVQASQLSAVAEELGAKIATLRGVGASEDGEVEVTVDHNGIPLDITVHDEALVYDGGQVSAMVLEATRRAIQDVQLQAEPIRAAMLAPLAAQPPRVDLSDRIQELYERIEEFEQGTRADRDDEEEERR